MPVSLKTNQRFPTHRIRLIKPNAWKKRGWRNFWFVCLDTVTETQIQYRLTFSTTSANTIPEFRWQYQNYTFYVTFRNINIFFSKTLFSLNKRSESWQMFWTQAGIQEPWLNETQSKTGKRKIKIRNYVITKLILFNIIKDLKIRNLTGHLMLTFGIRSFQIPVL